MTPGNPNLPNPPHPHLPPHPPSTTPPPAYGFHMLDRRTLVLADGSVRSYFALPDPPPLPKRPHPDAFPEDRRPLKHPRSDDPSPSARPSPDVDPLAVRKAFLRFAKMVYESAGVRKGYLGDGRRGRVSCLVCGRSSKEFSDMHGLIMHTYFSKNAELRVDHLGLHKALCVLMGWNYAVTPDDSKSYQSFSSKDATANREDLIIWPPSVFIHNLITGKRRDGRMEGMGNKEMDNKLKELGFSGGKSKSLYGKEGHLGVAVVKFANNQGGLREAERLSRHFEKENHGRQGWACAEEILASSSADSDPALVKVDKRTGDKKRVLYGYLLTASDLDKVDFDVRKKSVIKSRRDLD